VAWPYFRITVLHVASMSQYPRYADVRETRIADGFSWDAWRERREAGTVAV
jgi:hypothetical protein